MSIESDYHLTVDMWQVLRQPLETGPEVENEDDELLQKNKEYRYVPEKMTWDPNCYECKVRYRDPKSKDLVMYLHAWRYKVISFISTQMAPLCFALTEIGQF